MGRVTLFDSDYKEIGQSYISADIEISDSRQDIEVTSRIPDGCAGFAIMGDEAGGAFEYTKERPGTKPTIKAFTWRGLLSQWVLCPPAGADYLTISNMDLNRAIESVLQNVLGGFFKVPQTNSGINVSSYQFNLYTDALSGLTALCESVGAKLVIHAEKDSTLGRVVVYVEGKARREIEGQYDEQGKVILEFIENKMGYNHMICMGSGELQNRLRVDLYLQSDGSFGQNQYYTGFNERQYYYNDSSADTTDKLRENGLKKFPEICSSKKLNIYSAPDGLDIGDIITGKYVKKGLTVSSTVNKKIYKISGDTVKVEYSIKEVS